MNKFIGGLARPTPWAVAFRRFWRLVIAAFAAFGLAIVTGFFIAPAPVVPRAVEILNSPVQPGATLQVRAWRDKWRDAGCFLIALRSAQSDDGTHYILEPRAWEGGPASADYVDLRVPVPIYMRPGSYRFFSSVAYFCTGMSARLVNFPPAAFAVEVAE